MPPPRPPALVATDLDGTLVRSDGTISSRSRAALRRVEQAGSVLVLVTGRPPRWMAPVVEATGHRGLAVCANGALVYDLHTERVVRSHLLAGDAAVQVVEALRRELPGVTFAVEQGPGGDGVPGGFGRDPGYRPRWDVGAEIAVAPIEQLVGAGVVKLLARHDELGSDEFLAHARQVLGDLAELTHSSSDGLLEISGTGISKASGLAALAADHGLTAADAVAFGDMPNDLPMLAWAGHAVAVENAHPEVRALADEVTARNDDDGVALVLERLFART